MLRQFQIPASPSFNHNELSTTPAVPKGFVCKKTQKHVFLWASSRLNGIIIIIHVIQRKGFSNKTKQQFPLEPWRIPSMDLSKVFDKVLPEAGKDGIYQDGITFHFNC